MDVVKRSLRSVSQSCSWNLDEKEFGILRDQSTHTYTSQNMQIKKDRYLLAFASRNPILHFLQWLRTLGTIQLQPFFNCAAYFAIVRFGFGCREVALHVCRCLALSPTYYSVHA